MLRVTQVLCNDLVMRFITLMLSCYHKYLLLLNIFFMQCSGTIYYNLVESSDVCFTAGRGGATMPTNNSFPSIDHPSLP